MSKATIYAAAGEMTKHLTAAYIKHGNYTTPQDIRDTDCVKFAKELASHLHDTGLDRIARIRVMCEYDLKDEYDDWHSSAMTVHGASLPSGVTLADLDAYGPTDLHAWVRVNDRHYDPECQHGTTNIFELPFYKRIIQEIANQKQQTP